MRDKSQTQKMSDKNVGGVGAKDTNVTQIGSNNAVRIQKSAVRDVNIYITLNVQPADLRQAENSDTNGGVQGKLLSRVKISFREKRVKRGPRSASGGKRFHMTLRSHRRGP
ncbi:uncharacterized protein [Haliotis asinina]|uniref:uncharacterized protein n=1 Tax=Haliotis asinina TaxID=109174 RepID=UPI003531B86C